VPSAGMTRYSHWNEFHVAYFASEAHWNYFVAPFTDRMTLNANARSAELNSFSAERTEVPLRRQEALTMEYLVTMTTHVPEGTPEADVQEIRTREAARSRELATQGHLLRLWRPPLQPGEWRTLGLFAADSGGELEEVLASMPLRVWRTDAVTPLSPHPNDPALRLRRPRGSS
jgi:muconolactone D-isomerase